MRLSTGIFNPVDAIVLAFVLSFPFEPARGDHDPSRLELEFAIAVELEGIVYQRALRFKPDNIHIRQIRPRPPTLATAQIAVR